MKQTLSKQQLLFAILGGWILLNLIQGYFTELFRDEAYFWTWAKYPSMGYYDNAPMIGWLIFLTESWIPAELGVRMMPILLNAAALFFLYKSTDQKNPVLLFVICFSMFEVHVGGFFAAPDAPLIFFSSLFIYLLKHYKKEDSFGLAAWMGLVASGVFYSKYQGLMFLFFLFLPNYKLMARRSFWLMAIVSLVCSLPLLNYLLVSQFDTITYHLQSRTTENWGWDFIWSYLGGQLGVAGPLMSVLLLPAAFLIKSEDPFLKGLKFCFWGIQAFLLFMATRTWVEANWAASSLAPMIILAYQFISERMDWKKWAIRLAIPSFVIMALFRIYLMVDFLPIITNKRNEVHGWEEYMEAISDKAGDLPVVFFNSFGDPSKYIFYTGKLAHSVNNFAYHKTHYDLLPIEGQLLGKDVYMLNNWPSPGLTDTFPTPNGGLKYGGLVPDFFTYRDIQIFTTEDQYTIEQGATIKLSMSMVNGYEQDITFEENPSRLVDLYANFNEDGKWKHRSKLQRSMWKEVLVDTLEKELVIDIPGEMKPGRYLMNLGLQAGWMPAAINGRLVEINILEKE